MPTFNYDPEITAYFYGNSINAGICHYGMFSENSANNGSIIHNALFSQNSINNSEIGGDAIFDGNSINDGIVYGNAYVASTATVPPPSVMGEIIPF